MRTRIALLILAAALALPGCGKEAPPPTAPMTVADWEALPPSQKYTAENLERLKVGDPKLQTAEGWEAFSRTTLAKNRKKDFPNGQSPPRR